MSEGKSRLVGDSYMANPEDLVRLRALAKTMGVSRGALIRKAIEQLLDPPLASKATGAKGWS